MKAHILIVEDEAILYDRLSRFLLKENYSVAEYCPSVEEALKEIALQQPDLVLLDIDLQGKLTGLDLGERLHKEYNIPFIYVTQYDDYETFFKGLQTNHEQFIVKTKPRLDTSEVLRAIQTAIHKSKKTPTTKNGVMGLVNYLEDIREFGISGVTRVPIAYKDIAFFSTKTFINEQKEEEKVRINYIYFLTNSKQHFFLKTSLKELLPQLPYYFTRINEGTIVNLKTPFFKGRINGSRLSILHQEFLITNTYKKEVTKRIEKLYG